MVGLVSAERSVLVAGTRTARRQRVMMCHRPLTRSEIQELDEFRAAGIALLNVDPCSKGLLPQVDEFILALQEASSRGTKPFPIGEEMIDIAWALGVLIADQFIEDLDWRWSLIGPDDQEKYGILSPNSSLALYPSFFARECLENPERDFTALLIYNMVMAKRFDDVPADECLDLAQNVLRVIPR